MHRRILPGTIVAIALLAGCVAETPAALCESQCDPNATCATDAATGLGFCKCNAGYRGSGRLCEVEVAASTCTPTCDNGVCVRAATGTTRCRCNPGYYLEGGACVKAASCEDHNGGCQRWAQCVWDDPTPRCVCQYGMVENDGRCVPVGTWMRALLYIWIFYEDPAAGGSQCSADWNADVALKWQGNGRFTAENVNLSKPGGNGLTGNFTVQFTDYDLGLVDVDFDVVATHNGGTICTHDGSVPTFHWVTVHDPARDEVAAVGEEQQLVFLGNPWDAWYLNNGLRLVPPWGNVPAGTAPFNGTLEAKWE